MKNIKVSVACLFVLLPRNYQNPTAKTVPVQWFQGRDKKVIIINLKIVIEWVSSDSWINAVLTNAKLYPIDRDFEKTMNIVKRLYLREKKYIFLITVGVQFTSWKQSLNTCHLIHTAFKVVLSTLSRQQRRSRAFSCQRAFTKPRFTLSKLISS